MQDPLIRNLEKIIGSFPAEHGNRDRQNTELKSFEDPLWLITGLSERRWSLIDRLNNDNRADNLPGMSQNSLHLPPADADLLNKWTSRTLESIEAESRQSMKYGMFGSRRDVAKSLDPIYQGLVTEQRASKLLEA
jgi:hypothetical protein